MSEPLTGHPGVLPEISYATVTGRIAPILERSSVLAFDADGTLWSGDIGMDTYDVVLERGMLRADAQPGLMREAASFGVAITDDPNDQARLLYEAFRDGRYDEERAFAMMAWSLAGHTAEDVRAVATEVVDQVALATRIIPEAVAVLRWASARGTPIVVVSASPALVVEAALARLALPATRIFGMRAAEHHGLLLPWLSGVPTYGPGKAATLRAELPESTVSAAFGDSAFDLPMLQAAALPVAVRPKPELVARRGECPGLVRLAIAPEATNP